MPVGKLLALADRLAREQWHAEALRAYDAAIARDAWNPHAFAGKALVLRRTERSAEARAAVMAAAICIGQARRGEHEAAR